MSYLKDREIWLSNVPTGNPPTGYFWKFIQNGKVVVRDSSGNNQIMVATSGSQAITGSLTVTGGITGTVSSASYVEYSDVANKPALVSGSAQVTYSGLTGIPSGIVSGSAQIADFGIFATTGSNGFNGSQSITGSLTVTGQVVAQTLNVQQVTSSIVYSSGSNVFGNSLANTQQFTGSVGVTGSLTVNGASSFSSNLTATGNLNLQGAVTRNINFYDSSNTNINAQIQYDQISSNSGQLFFGTNNAGTFATRLTISNTGAATFSSSVSATTLSLSATVADYAATITNIQDDSQGLLVRATDNDSGLYLIRAQSSNSSVSQTWVDRFTLAKNGAATFSSFITAQSSGGSGLRIYGGSGTNQWDMYLNGANIRFSDNTGTGSVVFDRPLNGTSASFTDDVSLSGIKNVRWGLDDGTANARAWGIRNGYNASGDFVVLSSSTNNTTLNTVQLQIARTGAATFSNSITTSGNINVNSDGIFINRSSSGEPYVFFQKSGVNRGSIYGVTGGGLRIFDENDNQVLTITGGNVGIGTSSPFAKLEVVGGNNLPPSTGTQNYTIALRDPTSMVAGVGGSILLQGFKTSTSAIGNFAYIAGKKENGTAGNEAGFLSLGTFDSSGVPSERMRITSGGYLKASNTGTYVSTTTPYHELRNNTDSRVVIVSNSSATLTDQNGIMVYFSNAAPNNSTSDFIACEDSSVLRFEVRSNGGIANYQGNDVNLSDERVKKDIEPLESYWDKFKVIEIVKFKYKDQTHDDFNIGVIAQQVEQVAPEFVDVDGWDTKPKLDEEGNEIISTEEPLKSIYTADLHHATIKVLQEAMAKIEEQQTLIESLKSRIEILEQ